MIGITKASLCALVFGTLAAADPSRVQKRNNVASVAVPQPTDVEIAINEWEIDVNAVNTFLDGAAANLDNLAQLGSDANDAANNFAAEEPNQLNTLINWFADTNPNNKFEASDAFSCATNDLGVGTTIGNTVFNFKSLVLDVFQDIVEDAAAGNRDAVANLLNVVNSYRCCNVLPDLDIIWRDSAISAGLQIRTSLLGGVAITPARPATCSAFDCSKTEGASTCASEDNLAFGVPGSF